MRYPESERQINSMMKSFQKAVEAYSVDGDSFDMLIGASDDAVELVTLPMKSDQFNRNDELWDVEAWDEQIGFTFNGKNTKFIGFASPYISGTDEIKILVTGCNKMNSAVMILSITDDDLPGEWQNGPMTPELTRLLQPMRRAVAQHG